VCGYLTPQRKPQYGCTTTIPCVHKSRKDVLENLLPVWLGVHKLVHFKPFLDYLYEFWQYCCLRCIATCEKNVYRCTYSIRSWLKSTAVDFFRKLSAIYTHAVVRTNFCADYWLFAIFDRNFAKTVALSSDENKNCVVQLKEGSSERNVENWIKIDP